MQRRKPLLPVAGLVLLAACSRPPSHAFTTQRSTTPESTTTIAPAPDQPIAITGRGFELLAVAPVGQAASDAAWAGVLDTLNRYLQSAVLTPLRSGAPAGDLSPFFTTLVAGRVVAGGPDRAAFIDEAVAPVPATDVRSEAAVATLTALAGDDGVMSVVSADLELRLTGRVDGVPLTVLRTGELVLLPEGGIWRIDAWDLKVTRTLAHAVTTTTARS